MRGPDLGTDRILSRRSKDIDRSYVNNHVTWSQLRPSQAESVGRDGCHCCILSLLYLAQRPEVSPMTSRIVALLIAVATIGATLAAHADEQTEATPGLAYASSFFPVPSGTPINVRPWDNSAENQRVKLSFTEALNRRGVLLTDSGATLTLNFETEVDSLAVPSVGTGLGRVRDESRVHMEIQDNLLGGRTETRGGTTRYILRATLDDQQSGQRLWQGEASYTGAVTDETATFAAMAPVLVDGFGQTVHPKGFRIR